MTTPPAQQNTELSPRPRRARKGCSNLNSSYSYSSRPDVLHARLIDNDASISPDVQQSSSPTYVELYENASICTPPSPLPSIIDHADFAGPSSTFQPDPPTYNIYIYPSASIPIHPLSRRQRPVPHIGLRLRAYPHGRIDIIHRTSRYPARACPAPLKRIERLPFYAHPQTV
ncbi:hypothetical protein AB1N83_014059 [Pleurotus pulmonarius]